MNTQKSLQFSEVQAIARHLKMKFQNPLPGEKAQFKMAPYKRPNHHEALKVNPNPRRAAVLALFFQKENNPHILLMQRNEYDGAHSGQVCFPGGSIEGSDQNHIHTALREAHEELNVAPDHVEILGELSPLYIPPSKFLINPVVGIYKGEPLWKPDAFEVKDVLEVPVNVLLNNQNIKNGPVYAPSLKSKITVPYYQFENCTVWGATAMVISELNALFYE